jgi:ferric-chelate reductase
MALPFESSFDPVVAAKAKSQEEILRGEREDNYPLEVWYFLASFIFLVSIVNWADVAIGYLRARRQQRKLAQQLPEGSNRRGSIDLSRLPLALTDTFRALSFRWTIPIGRSYSLNVMQMLLTATYIVILYTWAFIHCKCIAYFVYYGHKPSTNRYCPGRLGQP